MLWSSGLSAIGVVGFTLNACDSGVDFDSIRICDFDNEIYGPIFS